MWSLKHGRAALMAAIVLAACGKDNPVGPGPLPKDSVAFSTSFAQCEVGRTVTLVVTATKAVTLVSSDPSVATVSGNGTVFCISAGTVSITAKAGEMSASATISVVVPPPPPPPPPVSFNLSLGFLPQDRGVPHSLKVKLTWATGEKEQSISIMTGNTVTMEVPRNIGMTDVLVYGDSRFYDASWKQDISFFSLTDKVVMIPKTYTTPMGLGAGTEHPVDVEGMWREVGETQAGGYDKTSWLAISSGDSPILGVADLPHTMCFDRQASDQNITLQDSTIIWNAIRDNFHQKVGMEVFVPGNFGQGCDTRFSFDESIPAFGRAGTWNMTLFSTPTSLFFTEIRPDMLAWYLEMVLVHELLHTLGFGHNVSWVGVMGQGPGSQALAITHRDVNAFHLVREVRLTELSLGGARSFEAARQ